MARRPGTVIALTGLALLALASMSGTASASDDRQPNAPIPIPADEEAQAQLAATVCQCAAELLASGYSITREGLRLCVVDRYWPTTTFPPIEADPDSVKQGWAMVSAFVVAYVDDPEAFEAEFCVGDPDDPDAPTPVTPQFVPTIPGQTQQIGDVVHTGTVNIADLCEPPIPEKLPIRILFGGQANGFYAEAYAFDELAWERITLDGVPETFFPTVADAIDGARTVVRQYVAAYCAGELDPTPLPIAPTPDPTPTVPITPATFLGPVPWEIGPLPPMDEYPWERPLIHKGADGTHWPTPGMFFLVREDNVPTDPILALDSILGIARVALASAYAMAGAGRQLSEIPASQVLAYVELIACSPWNDTAYGTSNEDAVGGSQGVAGHLRGINMYGRHHNNIAALAAGDAPRRSTHLNGASDPGVEGNNSKWAQLWLPPIRLDRLRDFGVVSTADLSWSNGDSVIVPPPVIWNHGVWAQVSPPGNSWGC